MSDKFFFKGKKEKKPKHSSYGYNTKRKIKSGTKESPLQLVVNSEARKQEVEALLLKHSLIGYVVIEADKTEDIKALQVLIDKPTTQRVDKKPQRNDPCECGSGKKYKKCCG